MVVVVSVNLSLLVLLLVLIDLKRHLYKPDIPEEHATISLHTLLSLPVSIMLSGTAAIDRSMFGTPGTKKKEEKG